MSDVAMVQQAFGVNRLLWDIAFRGAHRPACTLPCWRSWQ